MPVVAVALWLFPVVNQSCKRLSHYHIKKIHTISFKGQDIKTLQSRCDTLVSCRAILLYSWGMWHWNKGEWCLMLQTTWWFHLQGSENPDFSTLEDETTMLSDNNVHQSPSDVEPYPRGTETPTAWLQKPKNLYCSEAVQPVPQ